MFLIVIIVKSSFFEKIRVAERKLCFKSFVFINLHRAFKVCLSKPEFLKILKIISF